MELKQFVIFQAADSNERVIIQLPSKEARTPLDYIRYAKKLVDHSVTVQDIEGGANGAMCLLELTQEAVFERGWGADIIAVYTATVELRRAVRAAAKLASGRALKAINELLEDVKATLMVLGQSDAV